MTDPTQAPAAVDDQPQTGQPSEPTRPLASELATRPVPLPRDAQPDADEPIVHRIGPDETLITLSDAAKLLPRVDGRKVGISAIWRWCRTGLRGVRLPYLRAGRRIVTSKEALFAFFQSLADLDERVEPGRYAKPQFTTRRPISSRRRQRALAEADRILERARI